MRRFVENAPSGKSNYPSKTTIWLFLGRIEKMKPRRKPHLENEN